MEAQVEAISSNLKQIETTSKLVLKGLNQLRDSSHECNCKEELQETQTEIRAVSTRVDELQSHRTSLVDTQNDIQTQINEMRARMEEMQQTLLAVQTDDLKLQKKSEQTDDGADTLSEKHVASAFTDAAEHSEPLHIVSVTSEKSPKTELNVKTVKTNTTHNTDSVTAVASVDKTSGTTSRKETKAAENPVSKHIHTQSAKLSGGGPPDAEGVHALRRGGLEKMKDLEGVNAVICLDISESMATCNAWVQARTFVCNYLTGLEECRREYASRGLEVQNVALVTFGHETKIQALLTSDYNNARNILENLKLGGPSPLFGGLVYAMAAAWSPRQQQKVINGVMVNTKIILVTDGRLSELSLTAGPDMADNDMDATRTAILNLMQTFSLRDNDMFFIPVGDCDREFIELMSTVAEGKVKDVKYGRRLARRLHLTEDMKEIQEDAKRHFMKVISSGVGSGSEDMYRDTNSKTRPAVGTRVRRGPDWHWKQQDSDGPGTVIGHSADDVHVWVEWDADEHTNAYRYGNGDYDLLIVDEPRVPPPGKKVAVRWDDGKRGEYSYGEGGKYEIEFCKSGRSTSMGYRLESTPEASGQTTNFSVGGDQENATTTPWKNKNKNKNANVNK
ncbi:HERC2-like protein [Mya arenaria]|uniref:HERC2-like protein n=1 Tax=Mya arenaria TaxID=6604 RepID=A0ABY7DR99_MYAAR|nr:HERC2-like protein [Mya arenaria]